MGTQLGVERRLLELGQQQGLGHTPQRSAHPRGQGSQNRSANAFDQAAVLGGVHAPALASVQLLIELRTVKVGID